LGPFTLVDDDTPSDGADVPEPRTETLEAALKPAFILPIIIPHNPGTQFYLNVEADDVVQLIEDDWGTRWQNANDYWVAYLLGAYQGFKSRDSDPNGELPVLLGATMGGSGGSLIYDESIRDFVAHWNSTHPNDQVDPDEMRQDLVVHELGHALTNKGLHPVTGLDAKVNNWPQNQNSPDGVFVKHHDKSRYQPFYLDLIRKTERPLS
jgi:hypothetical protein